MATKGVHDIMAAQTLARFLPYSIQVGAYVLMDAADGKTHYIKNYVGSPTCSCTISAMFPN